jgi:hypothetical protein
LDKIYGIRNQQLPLLITGFCDSCSHNSRLCWIRGLASLGWKREGDGSTREAKSFVVFFFLIYQT